VSQYDNLFRELCDYANLFRVPNAALAATIHEAADAFWKYWRENGDTHKHGYYESTWGAINRALRSTSTSRADGS
jgi:hypothetical protein